MSDDVVIKEGVPLLSSFFGFYPPSHRYRCVRRRGVVSTDTLILFESSDLKEPKTTRSYTNTTQTHTNKTLNSKSWSMVVLTSHPP